MPRELLFTFEKPSISAKGAWRATTLHRAIRGLFRFVEVQVCPFTFRSLNTALPIFKVTERLYKYVFWALHVDYSCGIQVCLLATVLSFRVSEAKSH